MIARTLKADLVRRMESEPATFLLGPRHCGKTTLARTLSARYFDLEQDADRIRLDTQWPAVMRASGRVVFDEAPSWPALFPRLRAAIDADRHRNGRFLLLSSMSPTMLRDHSESLTGRAALVELTPLLAGETPDANLDDLWLRGGFPTVALDPERFPAWCHDYARTLAQRDLPLWGWPATLQVTDRFLRMVAAVHAQPWNASRLAAGMGLSHPTIDRYLDFLEGAFLVRRLPAWSGNICKRLRRTPKVYWRDSGLLHGLLRTASRDALLAQPWAGASWEGFVIEQILATLAARGHQIDPTHLRTSDGYGIDLVFELRGETWAVEAELTGSPSPQHLDRLNRAADLIGAHRRVLVSQVGVSSIGERQASCHLRDLLGMLG